MVRCCTVARLGEEYFKTVDGGSLRGGIAMLIRVEGDTRLGVTIVVEIVLSGVPASASKVEKACRSPWIVPFVIEALQSYTELSPSGTGFHVILRGVKRSAQFNLRFDPVTREGFEIHSTARYFTITGEHVAGTPLEIKTVSDASLPRVLIAMEARLPKKANSPTIGSRDTEPVSIRDDELLRRMFNSRNGAEIALLDGQRSCADGSSLSVKRTHAGQVGYTSRRLDVWRADDREGHSELR